jgi:hypothetical protein
MLPATQIIIERSRDIDKEIRELSLQLEEIYAMKRELNNQIWNLEVNITGARNRKDNILAGNGDTVDLDTIKSARKTFIKPCPADDCNGYLSTQWKCGLCDTKVCSKCFEIKPKTANDEEETNGGDEETKVADGPNAHICKEENLKTADEIRKSCKGCPKCGIMIYKIEGCNQMYCVSCNTAFSWASGKIETGRIHNPHYYEWLRKQNNGEIRREPGDVPCGGFPTAYDITRRFKLHDEQRTFVNRTHGSITHYDMVVRRNYQVTEGLDKNLDIRIKYLMNRIDEDKFKVLLQRREKSDQKKVAIYQVVDMFVNTGQDLYRSFYQKEITYNSLEHQLKELRTYVNEQFVNIGKQFSCITPYINANWY